jgi:hypothetical protein
MFSVESSAEVENVLDRYFVQDSDIVHFDTLDLMQIIIGSRAIHRQKQQNTLAAHHGVVTGNRYAEASTCIHPEQTSSAAQQVKNSPVAKQARAFTTIARERFSAGVGSIGGVFGLR